MNRIFAVISALVLAGCANLEPLSKWHAERDVEEKIGVLAHLDISWPKSTAALERALAYYRAEEVDAVVILGDPTKNGYANQRTVFDAAWKTAWRGAKEPRLVLAEDPYAYSGIMFTGAGSMPLTDLLCVQPLSGKMINAGSMHGIEVSGLFQRQDSRTLQAIAASAQGLLVLKRASSLTVKRLDFSSARAEEVGPAWVVDSEGLIHDAQAEKTPEFWEDTRIVVIKGYDKVGTVIYTVRWPPVLAQHTGARAFNYDVLLGEKVIRRVQSRFFYLPESRESAAITCVVAEDELMGAEPRFGVRPISSLGLVGKTVWSE